MKTQEEDSFNSLKNHLSLCEEILADAERDNAILSGRSEGGTEEELAGKHERLERLKASVEALRKFRVAWQNLKPEEREQQSQVMELIRQNQDLIMRIIVLDRDNENALLRKGQLPARHVPPAAQQKPHYVADLYRRRSGS